MVQDVEMILHEAGEGIYSDMSKLPQAPERSTDCGCSAASNFGI